ncbi:hypothetical protein BCV69DRAFT_284851 [Microstroma glucosiphilum]|uniref:Secreted protein n=1 Tax=Pseudomicrostroma glucosiphilum TaxID=1684307 RepID=A0A316U0Z9_9BASI|nr:hypothetical protein BCV69DRAFT_284851 [Pseudomicrostroma glucosiphilum]PWN18544.1 hypothetical protein BCV69DRAFT_284851 [Pseudomicrostroma glucosiphilum]
MLSTGDVVSFLLLFLAFTRTAEYRSCKQPGGLTHMSLVTDIAPCLPVVVCLRIQWDVMTLSPVMQVHLLPNFFVPVLMLCKVSDFVFEEAFNQRASPRRLNMMFSRSFSERDGTAFPRRVSPATGPPEPS